MRKSEAEKLMDDVWHDICRHGLPINARMGQNMETADQVKGYLLKHIKIDEAQGTIMDGETERCPIYKKTVGTSGAYCKWCGTYLREVGWL